MEAETLTPIQRNWRDYMLKKALDEKLDALFAEVPDAGCIDLEKVIYSSDAETYMASVPAKGAIPAWKPALDLSSVLIYTIEDDKLMKYKVNKQHKWVSRTQISRNPLYNIIAGEALRVVIPATLGFIIYSGLDTSTVDRQIGGTISSSGIGLTLYGASFLAPICRDEQKCDREAWKKYKEYRRIYSK